MNNANKVSAPIEPLAESVDKENIEPYSNDLYQQMVGSLLYLSTHTRPDICYSVNHVSKYNHNPSVKHMNLVRRFIKYVKGSLGHGITINKSTSSCPVMFVDVNWVLFINLCRSTTGWCLQIGTSIISWKSEVQKSIFLSSIESEYMALDSDTQEIIFIRGLITEIGITIELPTIIYEDNNSCISLDETTQISNRAKHIDIKYHFLRSPLTPKSNSFRFQVKRI